MTAIKVAEVVPLKQGLKPGYRSRKIVIENSCRGSSIKTRIETFLQFYYPENHPQVAEVVPLKQGLKLEGSE